jgi:hypothetical protein
LSNLGDAEREDAYEEICGSGSWQRLKSNVYIELGFFDEEKSDVRHSREMMSRLLIELN